MDKPARLAKAIRGKPPKRESTYGIWKGAEGVDPDLSQVLIPGANLDGSDMLLRFVPRGAHVTDLVADSRVLLSGNPVCIIARIVGDVTVAII